VAAKSKSRGKRPAPSSSKIPAVLIVMTVVILMGLGWILVHGGMSLPSWVTGYLSGEAGEEVTFEDLQSTTERYENRIREMERTHQAEIERFEKQIREMEETHKKEMAALRENYEQQMDELRLKVQLLQDEG